MNILDEIANAFDSSAIPVVVIEGRGSRSPEQDDAVWFSGRDWKLLTAEDWEDHSGAYYAFSPIAFRYYLASILYLSSHNPDRWLEPADNLISMLDRSPNVDYWDGFLTSRLLGLSKEQYQVLQYWLIFLFERGAPYAENSIERALTTVELLDSVSALRQQGGP